MREFIDRDKNPICLAERIGNKGKLYTVVSLGEESVSEDLEFRRVKEGVYNPEVSDETVSCSHRS